MLAGLGFAKENKTTSWWWTRTSSDFRWNDRAMLDVGFIGEMGFVMKVPVKAD